MTHIFEQLMMRSKVVWNTIYDNEAPRTRWNISTMLELYT